MQERIDKIRSTASERIGQAASQTALDAVRVEILGKKGELTQLLRGMGSLAPAQRPILGRLVNELRDEVEILLEQQGASLRVAALDARLQAETIDVTLPGRLVNWGSKHPLTLALEDIKRIFIGLGFEVVDGPEIETDYYNFAALNVPKDHPARDMQDTFYLTEDLLLRTQTSPVQIRTMEKQKPPVRMIAPGKTYRVDAADATHSPMFQQVEGLLVDENVTFGDLKGILTLALRQLFGKQRAIRFRPSYFPFTEPSAEVDISCFVCDGEGCRLCKKEGWIEILGAGMVHPAVFEAVGYDPEEVTGFAFGMGVERIAMLRYGIEDMRLFFEGDVRFLRQFA